MTLEPSRITLARLRSGLGKAQLAERLGTTARTITNYETQGAPERAAATLAEALGCPQAYLHLSALERWKKNEYFSEPDAVPRLLRNTWLQLPAAPEWNCTV